MPITIAGTGSYLPPTTVTNQEMVDVVGEKSSGWIERLLAIKERRFCQPLDQETGKPVQKVDEIEMAEKAAIKALERANISPDDVDGLWYVTCTQDLNQHPHFSRASLELHEKLGLSSHALALEMDAGCGGGIQALGLAAQLLEGSGKETMLVVASNAPSAYMDTELYRKTKAWLSMYLFGDGAGAFLLRRADKGGILASTQKVHPESPLMYFHKKGSSKKVYEINAKAVKDLYPQYMKEAILDLKSEYDFDLQEVKRFYFHQVNGRVLMAFADSFGIPQDKVAVHVDKYGNLAAAATLVLLDEDLRNGMVKQGDLCLFCVVGAGAQLGTALVRL